ncbi:hypothetical protein Patl1_34454 [Pistacia atlantica]|uniref:Uncharacterized protein n=1 Tax=Pistacia atlantica TaxID=434234 RepID=A0ACC0ZS47_9ROSI|nr:hypothetical protein Patl1_34454 [Pistacia atlantica]
MRLGLTMTGFQPVVELCIQAGVDIPEYPSRRRTRPIRMLGKRVVDRGGILEEPKPWRSRDKSPLVDLDTAGVYGRFPPPPLEDVPRIAQETMDAYEVVKSGVTKLMRKYSVKACGYCSEVHVGPWGHNAKLCGAYKHQWRDGKHGWQPAVVDEVFPPNYAGAQVPETYKPMMRLDIVVPETDEERHVA